MKTLIFDTETTGTDPVKNGILQIAYLIEIDGTVVLENNLKCKPFPQDIIVPEALEVNGITLEEIKTLPDPGVAYHTLLQDLGQFVNKYKKGDKYTPAGYNVRFDLDFLAQWFIKNNDKYFGSWQNWRGVDPLPIVNWLAYSGGLKLENHKLETVYKHFIGKEFDAHDALADVKATRELIVFFTDLLIKSKG